MSALLFEAASPCMPPSIHRSQRVIASRVRPNTSAVPCTGLHWLLHNFTPRYFIIYPAFGGGMLILSPARKNR